MENLRDYVYEIISYSIACRAIGIDCNLKTELKQKEEFQDLVCVILNDCKMTIAVNIFSKLKNRFKTKEKLHYQKEKIVHDTRMTLIVKSLIIHLRLKILVTYRKNYMTKCMQYKVTV